MLLASAGSSLTILCLCVAGKFGTAASTGVVITYKATYVAKHYWKRVSNRTVDESSIYCLRGRQVWNSS